MRARIWRRKSNTRWASSSRVRWSDSLYSGTSRNSRFAFFGLVVDFGSHAQVAVGKLWRESTNQRGTRTDPVAEKRREAGAICTVPSCDRAQTNRQTKHSGSTWKIGLGDCTPSSRCMSWKAREKRRKTTILRSTPARHRRIIPPYGRHYLGALPFCELQLISRVGSRQLLTLQHPFQPSPYSSRSKRPQSRNSARSLRSFRVRSISFLISSCSLPILSLRLRICWSRS
ncbi:hypothetical protein IWX49DRAFT_77043 [Phyllosticta citricarpa]